MILDFSLFLNPVILAIVALFAGILVYYINSVRYINASLRYLTNILRSFKKGNLVFRFKELDETFSNNPFISAYWIEFKNSLVFNEGVQVKTNDDVLKFKAMGSETASIQCTMDAGYFFNEETLINSKMNYKFISAVPTILTGLGPLFTFLHISLAFAKVNFATQEATISSVSALMAAMKVAAMISVVAVGTSIIFLIVERILYKNMCKAPLAEFQLEMSKLFDNISSEKFLVQLLNEARVSNGALSQIFNQLPEQMKTAFEKSFNASLIPYLDNLIFSVNKLNEQLVQASKGTSNILDDLFKSKDE